MLEKTLEKVARCLASLAQQPMLDTLQVRTPTRLLLCGPDASGVWSVSVPVVDARAVAHLKANRLRDADSFACDGGIAAPAKPLDVLNAIGPVCCTRNFDL